MLRIDRDKQNFSRLDEPTLAAVSITERYDLQEFISNSPCEFFSEIGQELFLVGKEVVPSQNVQDRIDLLALDKEGTCVIVELKRGNHKLHMLQAISYAGMVSQWEPQDFLRLLNDDQQEALSEFLEVDLEDINRQQRILLIAEAYDYALLIGAEWLSEQFGVDITCCRIAVAKDATTNSEYLVCSNLYPAPELAKEAVSRGRRRAGTGTGTGKGKWTDWDSALATVANDALVAYFKKELAAGRESYLQKRVLHFRLDGTRRWFAAARKQNAYVWQRGRFPGDVEFWQDGLAKPEDVQPVKDGACLRFFLNTDSDCQFFHRAATEQLQAAEWSDGTPEEDLVGSISEDGHRMNFDLHIGIDYSGAETPTSRLSGLRVYVTQSGTTQPVTTPAAPSGRHWNWTRQEIATWLIDQARSNLRFIAGIDHGFSFPISYFQKYNLDSWSQFLEDFAGHWPTHAPDTRVESILKDNVRPPHRTGCSKELRLTEKWTSSAKSVFRFGMQGSVAKSTHAGLPWLLRVRQEVGDRIHFWPFDGWAMPADKSILVEVYPSQKRKGSGLKKCIEN